VSGEYLCEGVTERRLLRRRNVVDEPYILTQNRTMKPLAFFLSGAGGGEMMEVI
jgi:hypothetical protein